MTREELTGEPNDGVGGYRFGCELEVQLAGNTSLESDLAFKGNIEEGPDFRVKARNAVAVAVNDRVAFKARLQASFRNRPARREIVVFDADPSSMAVAGGVVNALGRAMIENDELDTIFSTSLVFSF
jgi:hypothetical protein